MATSRLRRSLRQNSVASSAASSTASIAASSPAFLAAASRAQQLFMDTMGSTPPSSGTDEDASSSSPPMDLPPASTDHIGMAASGKQQGEIGSVHSLSYAGIPLDVGGCVSQASADTSQDRVVRMSAPPTVPDSLAGCQPPRIELAMKPQPNIPAFLNKLYNMVCDKSSEVLIRWSEDGTSFTVHNQEEFARQVLPRFFKHNNFSSFVRQLNMYGFHKVPHITHGVLIADPQYPADQWEFTHPHFQRNRPDLLSLVKRKTNQRPSSHGSQSASQAHGSIGGPSNALQLPAPSVVAGSSPAPLAAVPLSLPPSLDTGNSNGFLFDLLGSTSFDEDEFGDYHRESTADPSSFPFSQPPPAAPAPSLQNIRTVLSELSAIRQAQSSITNDLKTIQRENQILWQETIEQRQRHQKQQEVIDKILRFLASVFATDKIKSLKPSVNQAAPLSHSPSKRPRLMLEASGAPTKKSQSKPRPDQNNPAASSLPLPSESLYPSATVTEVVEEPHLNALTTAGKMNSSPPVASPAPSSLLESLLSQASLFQLTPTDGSTYLATPQTEHADDFQKRILQLMEQPAQPVTMTAPLFENVGSSTSQAGAGSAVAPSNPTLPGFLSPFSSTATSATTASTLSSPMIGDMSKTWVPVTSAGAITSSLADDIEVLDDNLQNLTYQLGLDEGDLNRLDSMDVDRFLEQYLNNAGVEEPVQSVVEPVRRP